MDFNPRCARRSFRRHRDLAALLDARMLFDPLQSGPHGRQRARHPFADHLVAVRGGVDQVHVLRHARRQQGGGRDLGAPRPGGAARPTRRTTQVGGADWSVRGRVALRRQRDYARDDGAVGDGGALGRDPLLRPLHRDFYGDDPDRDLLHAERRDRKNWGGVRADHPGLFRHDRGVGFALHHSIAVRVSRL